MVSISKTDKDVYRVKAKSGDCKGCHWIETKEWNKEKVLNELNGEGLEYLIGDLEV